MKKLICLLSSLVGLAAFSGAHADNFYAGAFGGANWVQNNHHHNHSRTGYLLGLDAGYKWCNGLRTEFEFAYRNNQNRHNGSWDGSHNHRSHRNNHHYTYAGLFNLLYDFDAFGCWCVKPFIGAGIGVASNKHHRNHSNDHNNSSSRRRCSFAWQLIAGLAYPLNDCVDLSLSYRFFRTTQEKINNHGLALGLNYNF